MKPTANRFVLPSGLARGLAIACMLSSVHAATWVGDSGQDWNSALNWNGDVAPTGNYLINSATAGVFPVLTANSSYTPVDVLIADGASTVGRFDQRAGSLSLAVVTNVGNWFIVGRSGGNGTYNLADTSTTGGALTGFGPGTGSLTVGKLWVGGAKFAGIGTGTVNINTSGTLTANSTQEFVDTGAPVIVGNASGAVGTVNLDGGTLQSNGNIYVGNGGAGTINQSGGIVNTTGTLFVARQVGTTGTGNYVMSGGTVNASSVDVGFGVNNTGAQQGTLTIGSGAIFNCANDFRTGYAGAVSCQANVNLNGGTLNIGTTAEKWMIIGQWDITNTTVNIDSGNLNLNANTDIRMKIQNNGGGTNVFSLNGGAITSFTDNGVTPTGDGFVDLMLSGTGTTNNTFNLNGGNLTVRGVVSSTNNGSRTFNFNGGTLKPTANSANFVNLGTGTAVANVRNGGAVIDSNGFNVTISQALVHSIIGGDNAIDGGLTKNGAGTLTLTGANTYTGPTTINAGTLVAGGTPTTSGLTVAAAAALSVEQPAVTLGSLTVPTATFGAASTLDIETSTGNAAEKLIVSSAAGLSFSTLGVNLYLDGSSNGAFGGTYTLFEYTGSFTGSLSGLSVLNPRAGYSYVFADTGSAITVQVIAGDTDGDGMDDFYEQNTPGLNYLVNDAAGNLDGDFATNLEEFIAGTDPNNASQDPLNTDNDGLLDSWEIANFTTITAQNGTGDPDGDLANNLSEFTNSTNPNSGAVWPDTDFDLMNDAWETAYFGNLAKDGTADTDGDSFNDLDEHDAHTDPSAATGSSVSPIWAGLKNRWSFNGNLNDSVGTSNASIVDVGANNIIYDDITTPTAIIMSGGARNASDYIKLGENLIPNTTSPVTIELWARQNSVKNWSRIFDFHTNTAEYLMMSWSMGTNPATDRFEFNDSGTSLYIDNSIQPYGTTDMHHIVVTLEPLAGSGGKTRVSLYSAPTSAADLGAPQAVAETTVNLVNFNDALNALGYSPWPDETANATYDEFRIWNGALYGWMREKLHDQGPDNATIPDADADRLPDDWETQYFSNTTTASSLTADNDADSFTNLDEYRAGSDPNNALITPDDTDGDGLADSWEVLWFANITAQNGSGDPDGDGLTNEQEETANSNPVDDEDGLPAAWEVFFFGNTTTQDGDDDSDGDGVSNLDEYLFSQPNVTASTPTDINGDGIADALQHKLLNQDALGSSSFDTGLNWNDSLAPAAGETYLVSVGNFRTPPVDGDYTFAGARLDLVEVYTGLPRFLFKGVGTVTVPQLVLSGGEVQNAATVNSTTRLAGSLVIRPQLPSYLAAVNGPLAIDSVMSGSGQVRLTGASTVTFTATNTYTGNINNIGGGMVLASTGSLKFVPTTDSVNNAITGTSAVTLDGAFEIDLSSASSTLGHSWDLITATGALNIGSTFSVTGFTPGAGAVGARIWYSGTYQYDEATGILSVQNNPDADADGMTDAWELTYFGSFSQGAADDFDGDGTENLTEFRLGLIPNDGTSAFAVTRSVTTGELTWPSAPGLSFRIERSTTLGSWTTLDAAYPAAAGPATSTSYTDSAPPFGTAFYRIGLNP